MPAQPIGARAALGAREVALLRAGDRVRDVGAGVTGASEAATVKAYGGIRVAQRQGAHRGERPSGALRGVLQPGHSSWHALQAQVGRVEQGGVGDGPERERAVRRLPGRLHGGAGRRRWSACLGICARATAASAAMPPRALPPGLAPLPLAPFNCRPPASPPGAQHPTPSRPSVCIAAQDASAGVHAPHHGACLAQAMLKSSVRAPGVAEVRPSTLAVHSVRATLAAQGRHWAPPHAIVSR